MRPLATVDGKLKTALSAAKFRLSMDLPYLARMAALLNLIWTDDVPTAAVRADGLMGFNPKFAAELLAEPNGQGKLFTVYLHEIWHLILRHGKRCEALGVLPEQFDLWNLACDAALNQSLAEMGCKFPTGKNAGCFPEIMPNVPGWALGLPLGKTAEWYFAQLVQGKGNKPQPGSGRAMSGACGDGVTQSQAELGQGDGSDGTKGKFSPEEIAEAGRAALSAIKAAAESGKLEGMLKGNLPAGLRLEIDAMMTPPKVPWQEILRRELAMGLERRAGMGDYVYGLPNRKQASFGWGDDCAIMAGPTDYQIDLAIIMDLSGSMTGGPMRDAAIEAGGIIMEFGPTRVIVADAAVHGDRRVHNTAELLDMMAGGGGTDMTPAFDLLRNAEQPPTLAICMTDGMIGSSGPEPAFPVIWCLTSNYESDVKCWGEIVHIHEEHKTGDGD